MSASETAGAFGALLSPDGARFRFWAPSQARVALQLVAGGSDGDSDSDGDGSGDGNGADAGDNGHGDDADARDRRIAMTRTDDGWHEAHVAGVAAGTRYRYAVRGDDGGERLVPDPASRSNPDGVHGASALVDPRAYRWLNDDWRGRPWHEAVVYEMHVGTFTADGTFAAAAKRLPELAALGITAIEMMPVASWAGSRNWGYDGVLHYAPQPDYGTPDELKAFVDAAHGLGVMVLLDVVYNHFGPDGNYLHGYCPEFFNPKHQTPWGAAINFDGEHNAPVRTFYVGNALHWIDEYRFDGLRLDAVHAIADDSPRHIVLEIAEAVAAGPGRDRHVHLVLENERNQASLLGSRESGGTGRATAQWNDDLHHAAHALLSGESDAYYADYADRPVERFATALGEGFVYQGQPSAFRDGKPHGEPSAGLPSTAFVSFLQNHDQVGNRAFGERIDRLAPADRLDAATACLLLSPHVPMFFMGEEFAASAPFLYFCDFSGELADAVSTGRRAEFGRFAAFADERARERIPDPIAVETFRASKLDWSERETGEHAHRLALVRRLLDLRVRALAPSLAGGAAPGALRVDGDAFALDWTLPDGSRWHMRANFGTDAQPGDVPDGASTVYADERSQAAANAITLAPNGVWVGRSAP